MAQANLPEMPAGPVLELYGQRKRFTVPVGLKCMLEEMTREVLRDQPTNIYEYLAEYLELKLQKQCGARARRKSWDQHRWSWEGGSLLGDDELADFLETHGLTFSAANRIATIIQAAYRGFRDRRRVQEIRTSLEKDELYLEYDGEDAYVTKDCQGNEIHFTAEDVEKILINYRLTMEEANKYAIKIQRTFRGFRTRESFAKHFPVLAERLKMIEDKQRKLSIALPPENPEDQDEHHQAATRIQSAFRGFKARKDVKKKREHAELQKQKMSRELELLGEDGAQSDNMEAEDTQEDESQAENTAEEEIQQPTTDGEIPGSTPSFGIDMNETDEDTEFEREEEPMEAEESKEAPEPSATDMPEDE